MRDINQRTLRGWLLALLLWAWHGSPLAGLDEGLAAYAAGDFEGAAREFAPLAGRGDALAQYHLGLLCEEGQGVTRNPVAARQWYLKAATQGNADAMFALGQIYAGGIGVKREVVLAYHLFDLAANGRHRLAAQERDRLAGSMSAEELAVARHLNGETLIAHIR